MITNFLQVEFLANNTLGIGLNENPKENAESVFAAARLICELSFTTNVIADIMNKRKRVRVKRDYRQKSRTSSLRLELYFPLILKIMIDALFTWHVRKSEEIGDTDFGDLNRDTARCILL